MCALQKPGWDAVGRTKHGKSTGGASLRWDNDKPIDSASFITGDSNNLEGLGFPDIKLSKV